MSNHVVSGLIVYPNLFKAKAFPKDPSSKPKFGCTILVPKGTPEAQAILEDCQAIIDDELGGDASVKCAVRDGDKNANSDFHGYLEIRANANEDKRPGVVNQQCDKILDPSLIQGGDQVNVDFSLYAYTQISRGVGAFLNNVQLIGKGDKIIGSAKKNPEDVFKKIGPASGSTAANSFLNS